LQDPRHGEFPVPPGGCAPQRRERVRAPDSGATLVRARGRLAWRWRILRHGLRPVGTSLDAAHRKASPVENWRLQKRLCRAAFIAGHRQAPRQGLPSCPPARHGLPATPGEGGFYVRRSIIRRHQITCGQSPHIVCRPNPPLQCAPWCAPWIVGAGLRDLTAEPVPTTFANCRRDHVNGVKPAPPHPPRVGAGRGAGFVCADPPFAATRIRADNHQISYSGQTRPYNARHGS